MPTRIIRDGILTSEKIDRLSESAELFYRRLMSVVDDYGRFSGNVTQIRAASYPLRIDKVTDEQVQKLLLEVAESELVLWYEINGKRYIQIVNFQQRTRTNSRYPGPKTRGTVILAGNCQSNDGLVGDEGGDGDEGEIGREDSLKVFQGLSIPNDLLSSEFQERMATWVDRRIGMGKKPKCGWQTFFQEQVDWLGGYDKPTALEILSASIRNNWQGLFPPKGNYASRKSNPNTGTLNDKPKPTYNVTERLRKT